MTTFTPVLLGGDIGVYAIARSFYEAFAVKSVILSNAAVAAITGSSICELRHIDSTTDPETVLAAFQQLEAEGRSERYVAMANFDATARAISSCADKLSEKWVLPFPDVETMDRVSQKSLFYKECAALGIDVPRTVVVDYAGADDPGWQPPAVPFEFPVVAKTSCSADWAKVTFPGKKKIYFLENSTELDDLLAQLRTAGYRAQFLVQELIPGDNTAMRSLTAYVDSRGEVSLLGSAHVLLEDHLPMMIGNPVAMFTEAYPELYEAASRYLRHVGYHGFANFDIKVDPRNGRAVFFEVNPRIGRNSYYLTAGGANPIAVMVRDHVFGEHQVEPGQPAQVVPNSILYTLVPLGLLRRYILDQELQDRVESLIKAGKVYDPTLGPHEKNWRRNLTVRAQKLNQYRKFAKYYPRPTDTSY